MPRVHAALFAGAAVLAAGTASAATGQWHTTTVDLPDGSVAEIQYLGEVPPRVTVSMPVVQDDQADEIAEYEEDDALPAATRARRVVQARPQPRPAAPYPAAPQFIVAGDVPKGSTYEYTLITTGLDGRVCAQRTEWRSRGKGKEPEIRRSDTGEGCAATSGGGPAMPASVPVPAPPIPRPKIVPVDPDAI